MNKYLYWGALPWEKDGGAVVNYYLLKKQYELRMTDEYYGVPKVIEELDPTFLPWVNFFYANVDDINKIMLQNNIPLVNIFHLGKDDIEKVINPIHDFGGKIVLHQTIHWSDDDILKSNRLGEIDKIVAPTQYAKSIFVNKKGLSAENIAYIPHGVDTSRYYKRRTVLEKQFNINKEKQKVILFSGRLSYWKGIQEVIPIMRKLIQEFNCVFIIRGGYFSGLNESIKLAMIFDRLSTNNKNLIFLPEWQHPNFMEELFSMSDILLSNSAHEGFNVPLIEGMACGAVPITTSIPNHIEIMGATGQNGILLDPRHGVGLVNDGRELRVANSDQLYGACKWLLENPDEMRVMGNRGIEHVRKNYDLTQQCIKWLSLYDSILEDKSLDDLMAEKIQE